MSICQAEKGFGWEKSVKKLPRPWTAKSGTAREDITDEWFLCLLWLFRKDLQKSLPQTENL